MEQLAVATWDSGRSSGSEVGNAASRRVAEKAGFLVEATLRQRHLRRGQRVDIWAGSLLKDEYRP